MQPSLVRKEREGQAEFTGDTWFYCHGKDAAVNAWEVRLTYPELQADVYLVATRASGLNIRVATED